jgi:hypothetical protein
MMPRSLDLVQGTVRVGVLSMVIVGWAACPANGLAATRSAERSTSVSSADPQRGRVNVHAGPLPTAAAELTRQTGMVIHVYGQPEGHETASFHAISAEQALRRLFGPDAQYAFRYESSTEATTPVEAWVWTRAAVREIRVAPPARTPTPTDDPYAKRLAIRRVVAEQSSASARTLIAALHDDDASVKNDAAAGLARLGDENVVDDLGALLVHEPEAELRATAAEILATMASPRALAALRPALTDPEQLVRGRAAAALVNFAGAPGLVSLREAAKDRSDEALQALRALSDSDNSRHQGQ